MARLVVLPGRAAPVDAEALSSLVEDGPRHTLVRLMDGEVFRVPLSLRATHFALTGFWLSSARRQALREEHAGLTAGQFAAVLAEAEAAEGARDG